VGQRGEEQIAADRVYPLIGFHPDLDLFKRIGVSFDAEIGAARARSRDAANFGPGVYVAGSVTAGYKISGNER